MEGQEIIIDSPATVSAEERLSIDVEEMRKHPGRWQVEDLGRVLNEAGVDVYRSRWSTWNNPRMDRLEVSTDGTVDIIGPWSSPGERRWTARVTNMTPEELERAGMKL